MDPDLGLIATGLLLGALVGGFHFGALWLTVQRVPSARRPRRFLAASTGLRLACTLAAFYGLLQLGPLVLAAGMGGFLAARQVGLKARAGSRTVTEPRAR